MRPSQEIVPFSRLKTTPYERVLLTVLFLCLCSSFVAEIESQKKRELLVL